jgi:hypothetical protein
VIVEFPANTPVTSPVFEMVAAAVLPEFHALDVAAVGEPVSCKVAFSQTEAPPVIVGRGFTVIVEVREHPLSLVYVIVVEPADRPTTSPSSETVATEVLLDIQGDEVAAVPFPVNCKVASLQTVVPPEIVGSEFTVMVIKAVVAHCPALGVNV